MEDLGQIFPLHCSYPQNAIQLYSKQHLSGQVWCFGWSFLLIGFNNTRNNIDFRVSAINTPGYPQGYGFGVVLKWWVLTISNPHKILRNGHQPVLRNVEQWSIFMLFSSEPTLGTLTLAQLVTDLHNIDIPFQTHECKFDSISVKFDICSCVCRK